MSFATVLCLIPENIYGRLLKIAENGLADGCQLFYLKIYGYFYSVAEFANSEDLDDCLNSLNSQYDIAWT